MNNGLRFSKLRQGRSFHRMTYICRWILLSVLLLCKIISIAQPIHGLTVERSKTAWIPLGNRHTFVPPLNPSLMHISYTWPSNTGYDWLQYWGRPQLSLHAFHHDLGNPSQLGYAYSILPSLGFVIAKAKLIRLMGTIGSGLAYHTKKFDKITNPANNAIGSHINNHTYFDISIDGLFMNRFGLRVGYQLSHLSNSRTSTPNSGLNMHGWQLGLTRYWPSSKSYIRQDIIKKSHAWAGDIMLGYGVLEHTFRGGSRYAAYFANAALAYKWSHYISTSMGLEYDYNQSVFQFHNQDFDDAEIARQKATKTSVFLAQKLRFGYVGMRFQGGYYLPFPEAKHDSTPHYIRIGLDIHPLKGKHRVDPYIGVSIKSHKAVAQYLGIYLGSQF
jgi:Lipid A 3-O-deacylase (PagL)